MRGLNNYNLPKRELVKDIMKFRKETRLEKELVNANIILSVHGGICTHLEPTE